MPVTSPCIGVCAVDTNHTCEGCFRTLDEIARWSAASDSEKQRILTLAMGRTYVGETTPDITIPSTEAKPATIRTS